eukprot:14995-Heterococcus_DN1.PRE.3
MEHMDKQGGQAWVTHYDVLLKAANGLPVSIPLLKHVQARLAYARKGMGLPPEPPLYRFTDTGFELYTTPTTAATATAAAADDDDSDVGSSAAVADAATVADAISDGHSAQLSSNGDTSDSNRLAAVKAEDAVVEHDDISSSNDTADDSAMAVDTGSSSAGTTLPTAAETAAVVAAAADVIADVTADVKTEVKPEAASTATAADSAPTAATDGAAAGDTTAVTAAAADTEATDVPTAASTAVETDAASSSADASTDAAAAQSVSADSAQPMEIDAGADSTSVTANGAAAAGDNTTAAASVVKQLATTAATADSTSTAAALDTTNDNTTAAAAHTTAAASNSTDVAGSATAADTPEAATEAEEAAMETETTAASESTTAAAATADGESQVVEEVRRLSKSEAEALAVTELSGFDPRDVLKGVTRLPAPSSITATMHAHQLDGLSWMVHMYSNGMPMILGDQMGLGKTLQSIAFMAHLKHTLQASGPFLVVVPLSVISNWLAEIERFCPRLRPVRFHGPKEERSRIKSDELAASSDTDAAVQAVAAAYAVSTPRLQYMCVAL